MRYQVYEAPLSLRGLVRYFWSIDHEEDGGKNKTIKIFADRFPRLIFQDLSNHVPTRTENGIILPAAFLSGIITRQTSYFVKGSYSHLGVSFYPHAIKAIFGVDAFELTDALPDLINFCPALLIDKLYDAHSHHKRVEILSEYLLSRLSKKTDRVITVSSIIHSNLSHLTPMKEILTSAAMSERSLERLFKSSLGISPKKYLRILRFEKSVEIITNSTCRNLSELAYNIGYSDQSHFNREFKELSGFAPKYFQKQKKIGQESASFLLK